MAQMRFKQCLFMVCGSCRMWFPRTSVTALLVWSLFSHIHLCNILGSKGATQVLCEIGVTFNLLAFIAYWRVILSGPGSPRDFPDLLGDEEYGVPEVMRQSVLAKSNGNYRYCSKCVCWKPDRSHHCSTCQCCILKMDHHCPWFGICVGFRNHKYFVQLLWYVVILSVIGLIAASIYITQFVWHDTFKNEYISVNSSIYGVVCFSFAIAVLVFGAFTTWLLINNRTTLEQTESMSYRTSLTARHFKHRRPPSMASLGNVFDLGWRANVAQVFGVNWLVWLLPLEPRRVPDLDGIQFPADKKVLARVDKLAENDASFQDRNRQIEMQMIGSIDKPKNAAVAHNNLF